MTKTELTTSFRVWTAVIKLVAPGTGTRRVYTKLEELNAGYAAEREERKAAELKAADLEELLEQTNKDFTSLLQTNRELRDENTRLRMALVEAVRANEANHASKSVAATMGYGTYTSDCEQTLPRIDTSEITKNTKITPLSQVDPIHYIPQQPNPNT